MQIQDNELSSIKDIIKANKYSKKQKDTKHAKKEIETRFRQAAKKADA